MTYQEWLKNEVILPNDIKITKADFLKFQELDKEAFNKMLFHEYNKKYPISDGRRYKK